MKKETKKYTLFSNGTEFMVWQTDNCEKCVKAVWFNEKTNTFPAYRCTIQRDIELACVTDGCGIKKGLRCGAEANLSVPKDGTKGL